MVPAMQAQQCKLRIGDFPDRWDGVRNALRFVHDHVHQAVVALEGERARGAPLAIEPGAVAKLDCQSESGEHGPTVLDVGEALRMQRYPRRELEMHRAELARTAKDIEHGPKLSP